MDKETPITSLLRKMESNHNSPRSVAKQASQPQSTEPVLFFHIKYPTTYHYVPNLPSQIQSTKTTLLLPGRVISKQSSEGRKPCSHRVDWFILTNVRFIWRGRWLKSATMLRCKDATFDLVCSQDPRWRFNCAGVVVVLLIVSIVRSWIPITTLMKISSCRSLQRSRTCCGKYVSGLLVEK